MDEGRNFLHNTVRLVFEDAGCEARILFVYPQKRRYPGIGR